MDKAGSYIRSKIPSFCKPVKLNRTLYLSKINHLNAVGAEARFGQVQALEFNNILHCF